MFGENSLLLEIRSAGDVGDYGDPDGTTGDLVWSGRVPATIRRARSLMGYEPQGAIRTGGGGRVDQVTLTDKDELIVRMIGDIPTSVVVGGSTDGWTALVEDRRNKRDITQTLYRLHGAELRAGDTPGQSLALSIADGV